MAHEVDERGLYEDSGDKKSTCKTTQIDTPTESFSCSHIQLVICMENIQKITSSCQDVISSSKPSIHLPHKSQFQIKVNLLHKESSISLIRRLKLASSPEELHCLFVEKHPDRLDTCIQELSLYSGTTPAAT